MVAQGPWDVAVKVDFDPETYDMHVVATTKGLEKVSLWGALQVLDASKTTHIIVC